MIVRELITRIGFNVDTRALTNVDNRVSAFSQRLTFAATRARRDAILFSAFATVPLVAAGRALLTTGRRAEQASNRFRSVFSNIETNAAAAVMELRNSFNQTTISSTELLARTGDTLANLGFSQQQALGLSLEINKLASSLNSFVNVQGGVESISRTLNEALLGQTDGLRSLGISINSADIRSELLTQRQKGLTFATERQAKAAAIATIALRQSSSAIATLDSGGNTFIEQSSRLSNAFEELQVAFAGPLRRIVESIIPVITAGVMAISQLPEGVINFIVQVGILLAIIAPLLFAFSALARGALFIAAGFRIIAASRIGSLFVALTGGIFSVTSSIADFLSLFFDLVTAFASFSAFRFVFRIFAAARASAFLATTFRTLVTVIRFLGLGFLFIKSLGIGSVFLRIISVVGSAVSIFRALGVAAFFAQGAIFGIPIAIVAAITAIIAALVYFSDTIRDWISDLGNFLSEGIANVFDVVSNVVRDWISDLGNFLPDGVKNVLNSVFGLVSNFVGSVKQALTDLLVSAGILSDTTVSSEATIRNEIIERQIGNPNADRLVDLRRQVEDMAAQAMRIIVSPQASLGADRGVSSSARSIINNNSNPVRNINVNSEVTVNVPQGTTQAQSEVLRQAARNMFDQQVERVLFENAELE